MYAARVLLGPHDAHNNHVVALIAPAAGETLFGLDDLGHVAEVVALALRPAQQVAIVVQQPAYGYRSGRPTGEEWFSVWDARSATEPRGDWPRLTRAEVEQLTGPLPLDGAWVLVQYPQAYDGPEPRPRTIVGGPYPTYATATAALRVDQPPPHHRTFSNHTSELSAEEQRQVAACSAGAAR